MPIEFNCMSETFKLEDQKVARFEICPVKTNAAEDGSTSCETCRPEESDFFTLYFRDAEGLATAVHDADAEEIAAALWLALSTHQVPVSYCDPDRGATLEGSPLDLTERLTEIIHDEIPGYDDIADFRVDDFENHPLANLREALAEVSGYNGEA